MALRPIHRDLAAPKIRAQIQINLAAPRIRALLRANRTRKATIHLITVYREAAAEEVRRLNRATSLWPTKFELTFALFSSALGVLAGGGSQSNQGDGNNAGGLVAVSNVELGTKI